MSVKGLGTDIVEIERIKKALSSSNRLAQRVLTEFEMQIFLEHRQPDRYLAKRWAAKEAAAKAFGTGIGRGISFQHFEIKNDHLGAPKLILTGPVLQLAEERGISSVMLSISDETHYAMAVVVLS